MNEIEATERSAYQAKRRAQLREIAAEIYRLKGRAASRVSDSEADLADEILGLEQEHDVLKAQVDEVNAATQEIFKNSKDRIENALTKLSTSISRIRTKLA